MHRIKLTILILISIFFIIIGIDLLISAYRLTDPFNFILMFFASNLMILISAALCIGFILRLRASFRPPVPNNEESDQSQKPPLG